MSVQPNRRLLRVLIGGAAATALAVPGTAYAQSLRHSDPAHDVQVGGGTSLKNAPHNKTGDIVRLVATHSRTKVSAEIKLRSYGGGRWVWVERIKTGTTEYSVQGTHSSAGTTFTLTKGSGTPITCDITHATSTSRDTIRVTVPTSCLRKPGSVRIGVGYVIPSKSGSTAFADDALRTRGVSEQNLTLSKRLGR